MGGALLALDEAVDSKNRGDSGDAGLGNSKVLATIGLVATAGESTSLGAFGKMSLLRGRATFRCCCGGMFGAFRAAGGGIARAGGAPTGGGAKDPPPN